MLQFRHLALVATSLLSMASCYRLDVAECAASCATRSDCPGSLECTAGGRCATSAMTVCSDEVDAGTGHIEVTVLDDRGQAAIGIRVIAMTVDGTLISEVTTSGNGKASIAVVGEADVTIVRTSGVGRTLTTIRGATSGDALVFGKRINTPPSVPHAVSWLAPTNGTIPARYTIQSSCRDATFTTNDSAARTASFSLDPTCAADHDILVTYSGMLGESPGYQFASSVSGTLTPFGASWSGYTTSRSEERRVGKECA